MLCGTAQLPTILSTTSARAAISDCVASARRRSLATSIAVKGLAPTGRAAHQLAEAGMPTTTLQRHLIEPSGAVEGRPRLYVLDESSLASTRPMHTLLTRLQPQDRVLLVGDARQHQAVDAGRPYEQLQDAGLAVARLHEIKRQQDPGLKAVVERLSEGRFVRRWAGSRRRASACDSRAG